MVAQQDAPMVKKGDRISDHFNYGANGGCLGFMRNKAQGF